MQKRELQFRRITGGGRKPRESESVTLLIFKMSWIVDYVNPIAKLLYYSEIFTMLRHGSSSRRVLWP